MSITIPIWSIFILLYIIICIFVIGIGIGVEKRFVNPSYKFVIIAGLIWPILFLNIIIGKITGVYIISRIYKKYNSEY